MKMSQLTIMNASVGKYALIVSDGREYGDLSEVGLIQKIEELLSEGYTISIEVGKKEEEK